MEELKNQIMEALETIDRTTNLFYQQKSQEGYQELTVMLGNVSQVVGTIAQIKASGIEPGIDENKLLMACQEAMKAMESKDTVLLSDILEYELKEVLQEIL